MTKEEDLKYVECVHHNNLASCSICKQPTESKEQGSLPSYEDIKANIYPSINGLYGADCDESFCRGAKWMRNEANIIIEELKEEVRQLNNVNKSLAVK